LQFGWAHERGGVGWDDEALATANTDEGTSNNALGKVEFGVGQSSLFLTCLMLQLLLEPINLSLLVLDHRVHLLNLSVSLEFLLLKHQVILLNLV